MNKFNAGVLSGLFLLSGCAHTMMRGTVAMKVSDREAHVCMGENEVKAGDRVAFFVNKCRGQGREALRTCELIRVGEGTVVKPLNEHYSVVEANPGVKLEEGTIVQKL